MTRFGSSKQTTYTYYTSNTASSSHFSLLNANPIATQSHQISGLLLPAADDPQQNASTPDVSYHLLYFCWWHLCERQSPVETRKNILLEMANGGYSFSTLHIIPTM